MALTPRRRKEGDLYDRMTLADVVRVSKEAGSAFFDRNSLKLRNRKTTSYVIKNMRDRVFVMDKGTGELWEFSRMTGKLYPLPPLDEL